MKTMTKRKLLEDYILASSESEQKQKAELVEKCFSDLVSYNWYSDRKESKNCVKIVKPII